MLSKKEKCLREKSPLPGGTPGGGDVGSRFPPSRRQPHSHTVAHKHKPGLPLGGTQRWGDWWTEFTESEHPPRLERAVSFLWNPQEELGRGRFPPYGPAIELAWGAVGHRTGAAAEQWVPQLRNDKTNRNDRTRCSQREHRGRTEIPKFLSCPMSLPRLQG